MSQRGPIKIPHRWLSFHANAFEVSLEDPLKNYNLEEIHYLFHILAQPSA